MAISMAMAMQRYDAGRIARQSISRASFEATGCLHRASACAVSPRRPPWSKNSNKTHKTLTKHNFQLATTVHFERQLFVRIASKEHRKSNTKGSPYSGHWCHELRPWKSGHGCSQRAGLDGVSLEKPRRPKLAQKLRFYEASKKNGRIYAPTGLKLLRPEYISRHFHSSHLKPIQTVQV